MRPWRLGSTFAVVLVTMTALWFTVGPDAAQRAASAAGDCIADPALDAEEQQFLVLINNHRAANGLPPLQASYLLSKAAQWKSQDLGQNAYFAHDDLTRTWVQRIRDCGYGYNTWLGENIAAGVSSGQAAFDLWKNSPGHNANMLGSNYSAIGIGRAYVSGSPYGWYWTTDFGGVVDPWPGSTPTSTATAMRTSTPTPTRTATATSTRTPTATPTGTSTSTASPTPTATRAPDTTRPTVSITAPANGATLTGSSVIAASASDAGSGIHKVRFWVDGTYLGYDVSAPYSRTWDTRLYFNKSHVLKVQALDRAGNSSWAQIAVTVTNPDGTPPSVTLTAPSAGAIVLGDVIVGATASDVGTAVNKVRFWVDGTYLGYDTAAPYAMTWNTAALPNGSHVIKAQAVDNANNGSAIGQITVTVSN